MINLESTIERSRALMGIVEEKRPYRIPKANSARGTSDPQLAMFEAQADLSPSPSTGMAMNTQPQIQNTNNQSNPIMESFTKTPPMSGEYRTYQPQSQQYQPMQQYQPNNAGIDYNYLKYIINECIKENLGNVEQLNESGSIKAMRIANGNKLQFVDSKGNLYEGVLTLKKKAQPK